jgi:AraC-like DNA-binding protein
MAATDLTLLFAISQALFLGLASWLFQTNRQVKILLGILSLCMIAYFYRFFIDVDNAPVLAYLLGRLSYGIPAAIWLLAFSLFRPEHKIPTYAWASIATYFLLRSFGVAYFPLGREAPFQPDHDTSIYILFYVIPQIINIGMYVHTLFLSASEYRQDLIESRRHLRVYFVAILGSFWLIVSLQVSASVLIRMGWGSDHLDTIYRVATSNIQLLIFPTLLISNLLFFKILSFKRDVNNTSEYYIGDNKTSNIIDPKDIELKDKLLKSMVTDRHYLKAGLTIVSLAKELGTQEYKLRLVINQVLGYTNFSCFLNRYRIEDAEERLIRSDEPICNVGLDVGYSSLSSFHKAFKEKHGITPKAFRIVNMNGNAPSSYEESFNAK